MTAKTRKSVLVVSRFFEPAYRGGGPIQTLSALVRSLPEHIEPWILTSNEDLGSREQIVDGASGWVQRPSCSAWYLRRGTRQLFLGLKATKRDAQPDLVYLNSFFDFKFSILFQMLFAFRFWHRAGLVIAPRGELHPGALALKARKKRLFIQIYRSLGFAKKIVWHASTAMEAGHIRHRFGQQCTVVVRENETSLPQTAVQRASRNPGPCRLVFVSRLAEKKGFHIALEGLQRMTHPAVLDVVGEFEDDAYRDLCVGLINKVPNGVRVRMQGARPRDEVLGQLSESDLLVFPTAGENFGHVIAESLSQACPVMCTDSTIWTERLESGAGIVVGSREPEDWSLALEDFIKSGPAYWEGKSRAAEREFGLWRREEKGKDVFSMVLDLS